MVKVDASDDNPPPLHRSLTVDHIEPASPAAQAGLQAGDVLVKAAGQPLECCLDLERALLGHSAGERVGMVVRRKGTEQSVDLVLQIVERPAPPAPLDVVWKKLGVRLRPVEPELVSRASSQLHGGLAVVDVRAESAAGKAGIQRGDILVGLHQWETLSLDNVVFFLTHPDLASFSPVRFYVIRNGQVRRGTLPMD